MQVTLSESRRVRKRTNGGAVVSVLLHTVLLAGAIAGTAISKTPEPITEHVDTLVYTPPAPTPVTPVPERTDGGTISEVPTVLPPIPEKIELVEPVIDLGLSTIPQTVPVGEFVAPKPRGSAPAPSSTRIADQPFDATDVDRVVLPRSGNPAPRYPQLLASAGVEGGVVARFVVDTLGRVEQGSVRIIQSTHIQFEQAVREIMPRMRFTPAEVRGVHVRQLVEQSFQFELRR